MMINLPLNSLQDFVRHVTKNEHLFVYQVEDTLLIMDESGSCDTIEMGIPDTTWWSGYNDDEKALSTFVMMLVDKIKGEKTE